MKKLIAVLSAVPVCVMAHPGHGVQVHFVIHPGFIFPAVIAGLFLALRTFTRHSARGR